MRRVTTEFVRLRFTAELQTRLAYSGALRRTWEGSMAKTDDSPSKEPSHEI